jgi:hypothetical protein
MTDKDVIEQVIGHRDLRVLGATAIEAEAWRLRDVIGRPERATPHDLARERGGHSGRQGGGRPERSCGVEVPSGVADMECVGAGRLAGQEGHPGPMADRRTSARRGNLTGSNMRFFRN